MEQITFWWLNIKIKHVNTCVLYIYVFIKKNVLYAKKICTVFKLLKCMYMFIVSTFLLFDFHAT